MKFRSTIVLAVMVALVAVLAVGVVGCGGPMTEDEYKEEAGQAVKDLVAAMEEFNTMEEPETIEDARTVLGEQVDKISDVKKTIDGFDPPDKYKDTNDTLKSAAEGIESFFTEAKKAFDESESMEEASTAFEGLESMFEDFMKAAADLQTVADELGVTIE
ncbi:MAG: hypothetical protein OEV43_02335 [Coriobacteriia bacterium]|nr:hypothetical protein [Coriobacteriia bacterium]